MPLIIPISVKRFDEPEMEHNSEQMIKPVFFKPYNSNLFRNHTNLQDRQDSSLNSSWFQIQFHL